ncbi:arabinofuranosyltransferase [Corynebacterium uterequi]|nr:arabinofuranosyltransferase [Corynebacterium uterequi]
MLSACLGAAAFAFVGWVGLKAVSLPAFNTSMVLRALASAAMFLLIMVTAGLLLWWRYGATSPGRIRRWLTYAVAYLAPAGLVFAAVAIPLAASRLYLDGIQIDQMFRSQFLTRMAVTWHNEDMNYADLPSYYPIGWFWLGGRLAAALGMPGWAVYQPWAIVSLASAASLLVPVWQRLTGSLPLATSLALATTALTLVASAPEPYAAIIAMGVPPAIVLTDRAVRGSWFATAAMAVFLGVAACFYTLFPAVMALVVVVMAVATRPWRVSLTHLLAVGFGSLLLALIAWAPYLWRTLTGDEVAESTAAQYLPEEGTLFTVQFFLPTLVGLLCLAGIGYLVLRRSEPTPRAFLIALAVLYLWELGSMLAPLVGTTLIGFRLGTVVVVTVACCGVWALAALLRWVSARGDGRNAAVAVSVALVLMGFSYAQTIPARLEHLIDLAYSDTDGYGERGDRKAPNRVQFYPRIDDAIRAAGYSPTETVVLTDENLFLSYYPYLGFNAMTSHYANPLGEFSQRNDFIEQLAARSHEPGMTPAAFAAEVAKSPWRPPQVFLLRGGDEWQLGLARNLFPNQPNVRHDPVTFNPRVFDDPELWTVTEVDQFVVVTARA